MSDVLLLAHNYVSPSLHEITWNNGGSVEDTGGICKRGVALKGKKDVKALITAVAFMAEDFYTLAGGTVRTFIPVARIKDGTFLMPRCPMVQPQPENIGYVLKENIEEAVKKHPDALVGTYINSNVAIAALEEVDFVYNGTVAAKLLSAIASEHPRKQCILAGDTAVTYSVKKAVQNKWPDFQVYGVPETCFCPTHKLIDPGDVMFAYEDAVQEVGEKDVLLDVHAEVDPRLIDFTIDHNGVVAGSGGMIEAALSATQKIIIVVTEEGAVSRIKSGAKGKKIVSFGANCPNMKLNSRDEHFWVFNDLKSLKSEPKIAAKFIVEKSEYPYYRFESVGEGKTVELGKDDILIGPCEIIVEEEIRKKAETHLQALLDPIKFAKELSEKLK
ncbi:MAG: quinolinate synthase NadA [Candidatus Bathyarchaeota archaeon]